MDILVTRNVSVGLENFIYYELEDSKHCIATTNTSVKMFMLLFDENKYRLLLEKEYSIFDKEEQKLFLLYILNDNHKELERVSSKYINEFQEVDKRIYNF